MSILGKFNKYLFQWFFCRLTRCEEEVIDEYKLLSVDLIIGSEALSFRGTGTAEKRFWYSLQIGVLPLSGWGNNFKYVFGGPKFLRLTHKFKHNNK